LGGADNRRRSLYDCLTFATAHAIPRSPATVELTVPCSALAADIFDPDLARALHATRAHEHARAHLKSPQRPADRRSNEGRRYARVDGDPHAAIAQIYGAVHHHCLTHVNGNLPGRHDIPVHALCCE
jgi:hypothetical protein